MLVCLKGWLRVLFVAAALPSPDPDRGRPAAKPDDAEQSDATDEPDTVRCRLPRAVTMARCCSWMVTMSLLGPRVTAPRIKTELTKLKVICWARYS